MKVRLGYVSLSLSLNITASRTITYTNYLKLNENEKKAKMDKIIKENFESLEEILKYNYKNSIHFYRLSHKLIPLATHESVSFDYINPYEKYYKKIGNLIKDYGIRLDVHPDQFCVLNSNNEKVYKGALEILKYCLKIFKAMDIDGKTVLHVGGAYENKEKSIEKFKDNFKKLPLEIKEMIILENDDKIYNVEDVLKICEELNIPMVLDYHHYICNNNGENINKYLPRIIKTWKNTNLPPKMHFSSAKNKKEQRSHSEYINVFDFIEFLNILKKYNTDIDVMLECKAKDEALFRLTRLLKYLGYKFTDDTTLDI